VVGYSFTKEVLEPKPRVPQGFAEIAGTVPDKVTLLFIGGFSSDLRSL
jgi:hypothetical protein